ncbi:hypothetical protein SeMB42_g06210 [Synchytrium endobioticum]|uniref:Uncharacterized protein n=1 Tax=Synchytrium endobioticum TaxID=286115 RepID=A0A507CJM7_9FUNG|nr:hypothetical protein SeMB42_g06210 [Synchytrium endobioticum]
MSPLQDNLFPFLPPPLPKVVRTNYFAIPILATLTDNNWRRTRPAPDSTSTVSIIDENDDDFPEARLDLEDEMHQLMAEPAQDAAADARASICRCVIS